VTDSGEIDVPVHLPQSRPFRLDRLLGGALLPSSPQADDKLPREPMTQPSPGFDRYEILGHLPADTQC